VWSYGISFFIVPVEVADEELFWLRYHFRLYEIEEEEKRRKKLVQGKQP
jgi:hypothetical protein